MVAFCDGGGGGERTDAAVHAARPARCDAAPTAAAAAAAGAAPTAAAAARAGPAFHVARCDAAVIAAAAAKACSLIWAAWSCTNTSHSRQRERNNILPFCAQLISPDSHRQSAPCCWSHTWK